MELQETAFLESSLKLAEQARTKGNRPFGAVLVHRGKVLSQAENTVVTDRDITAHAELNVIRKVSGVVSPEILAECTLYCSTEPCAMCSGAIYWSGIRAVVFGCSSRVLSEIAPGGLELSCREVFRHGSRPIQVTGPADGEAFKKIHEDFWKP